jgi:TPR repeat protein
MRDERPPLPEDGGLVCTICEHCLAANPDERPEFFHVVFALQSSDAPLFEGQDSDIVNEYIANTVGKTIKSAEAEAVFNTKETVIPQPPRTSMDELIARADAGDAHSQLLVSRAYVHGSSVPLNYVKAFEYARRAADQGNITAACNVGMYLMRGRGCSTDLSAGAEYLRKSAERGFIRGKLEFAYALSEGLGVPKNLPLAMEYYRQAADQGSVLGMFQYAQMCMDEGVTKNNADARRYFMMAHNAGDSRASCSYAATLYQGIGGPVDRTRAINIYIQAGQAGCAIAWLNLGDLYHSEQKLNNKPQAYNCYERAVVLGSPTAKTRLAMYLRKGWGNIRIDPVRARALLKEVADITEETADYITAAQNVLGIMYQTGEGGAVDLAAAFDYSGRAAANHSPRAVVRYADLVITGPPTLPRDVPKTLGYLRQMIANYQGNPEFRDDVIRAKNLLARLQ